MHEEDDFDDEPMELAPSRIEKALRLPLAALPFGGIVLELLDLASAQYDSAIAQTVGEIIAGTGVELLTREPEMTQGSARPSSRPSARPDEPVWKPSGVRSVS